MYRQCHKGAFCTQGQPKFVLIREYIAALLIFDFDAYQQTFEEAIDRKTSNTEFLHTRACTYEVTDSIYQKYEITRELIALLLTCNF